MYEHIAALVLRHRVKVVALMISLGIVCGLTALKLRFDFTPQQLFKSTSDYDALRERFAARFGREDNLLSVIVQGPDVRSPAGLTYVHRLTLDLRKLKRVKQVDSLTTLELPRQGPDGGLTTRPLVVEQLAARGLDAEDPKVEIDAKIAASLQKLIKQEPLLRDRLISSDGTVAPVLMWIDDSIQDATVLEQINADVRAVLAARPPPKGFQIRLGGIPQVRVDVVQQLRREQLSFIPLTGVAYLIILVLLFRRPAGPLLPVGVVALTASYTVALLVVTDKGINIINNILPSLIFIIGVSDSIHMLTRHAEEIEQGQDHQGAIKAMVKHTGVACLLTSTTTAVGFVSLLVADTDILKDLGWQAAAAVMFAYVSTLLFLPAMLTWMRPVHRIVTEDGGGINPLDAESVAHAPIIERGILFVGHTVLRWPKASLTLGVAITALFAALGARVVIDTTLLEIYTEDHPTFQTTKLLEKKLGGILPVELSLDAKQRDAFKDPKNFKKLHELQKFAGSLDGVLSTQSMVDFHQGARAALISPDQRDVLPDSRAQIEQLHLLIEGPPDTHAGVRGFITNDFANARILLRVEDMGAKAMIKHSERIKEKMNELFPKSEGWDAYITGDAFVASVALDSFVRDLFSSLLLAIVIIFIMMTFVFRSLKIGLISMIPNITPLVLTFGYMGYAGITLNTTTVIIFAISLGLAVDDTIHFLARFREEASVHDNAYDALIATYFGAGRAIMLTSVMLLVGLFVLLFSSFVPTNLFGKLTAITIAGALLGDLLMLPPLLLLIYKKHPEDAAKLADVTHIENEPNI